jgi:hypothetical protein
VTNYQPFTITQRDALITLALNRRERNLTGDLGPRCPICSGLGAFLRLGNSENGITRATSRCSCEGTGIDLAVLERNDREAMWRRILEIESRSGLAITSLAKLPNIQASRQAWMELISWATADATAVANTTTETIVVPNVTIPANYMQDGRALRLGAAGKYSTLGSGTVTLVFTLRWGGVAGTLLTKTGTITTLISQTNAYWEIELKLQTRSNGASGSILADGWAKVFSGTAPTVGSATGAPAIAPMTNGGQTAPAAATVDLTADAALSLTVTHGAASASNTATGQHYTIESMN